MIPLVIKAQLNGRSDPIVLRLNADWKPDFSEFDAYVRRLSDREVIFQTRWGELILDSLEAGSLDGDVILVIPAKRLALRLIRASSEHNTLLITEQCDQLCAMCSQPPKAKHVDMFGYYELAVLLAPQGITVGFSGGEPTLYKDELFALLERCLTRRPDLTFHVLSNGQHFDSSDIEFLRSFPSRSLLWGIPIYSSVGANHDAIVGKPGAYSRLQTSLAVLMEAEASVELRTVLLKSNACQLPALADHIGLRLPFVQHWAIMQLEKIGYGRKNWRDLFFDNSRDFSLISEAIDTAMAHGIEPLLFNFPLCTVPKLYREFAPRTISDWKQKYLDICEGCELRADCGGFFEWYDAKDGFAALGTGEQ